MQGRIDAHHIGKHRDRKYRNADAELWRKWIRENKSNMKACAKHFNKDYNTLVKVLHAHMYNELDD